MSSQVLTPARSRLAASYRNLTLWTLQGWLAMFFIAAGYAKLTVSLETLTALMSWPAGPPAGVSGAAQTPDAVHVRRLLGRQWGVAKR